MQGVIREAHVPHASYFRRAGGEIKVPVVENRIRFDARELMDGLTLANCLDRDVTFDLDGCKAVRVRPFKN